MYHHEATFEAFSILLIYKNFKVESQFAEMMCITKFSASTSGHDRESCKFNSIVSEITHTLSFRDGFDS